MGDSVGEIRRIVSELKDQDTAEPELLGGLRMEASLSRRSLGFAPSLIVRLDNEVCTLDNMERMEERLRHRLPDSLISDVLAVVREGLTNVARHAHATEVRLEVDIWFNPGLVPPRCALNEASVPLPTQTNGMLRVEIQDDGCGLDSRIDHHSGLANMTARATIHLGMMRIGKRPDGTSGTLLTWCIPLN